MSESISEQEEVVRRLRVQYERELERLAYLKAMERLGINDDEVITEDDFTVRAFNVLKKAGIRTDRDLRKYPALDLYKMENCGKKTMQEIKDYKKRKGLV